MPGKKKLTDLTGDGKITRKDFLRGAGVPGFEKGGKVTNTEKTAASEDAYEDQKIKYARVPMEPVSGEEPSAFEDAMRYERRQACRGSRSAIRGKKFSGTY
jgi:hypothetical protein